MIEVAIKCCPALLPGKPTHFWGSLASLSQHKHHQSFEKCYGQLVKLKVKLILVNHLFNLNVGDTLLSDHIPGLYDVSTAHSLVKPHTSAQDCRIIGRSPPFSNFKKKFVCFSLPDFVCNYTGDLSSWFQST